MERDRTPVYVEYHDGRPFSVLTASGDYYDFDYCKRDGNIYYHCSGSGPTKSTVYSPRFCEPKETVKAVRIWIRKGLTLVDERGRTVRKHESRGYRLLKRLPGNPFKRSDVIECETVYCPTCDDRLPDDRDSPCEHIWFCGACDAIGGVADGATCKHKTRDEAEAAEFGYEEEAGPAAQPQEQE